MDAKRPHTPFAIKAIWGIVYATFLAPFVIAFVLFGLMAILTAANNYQLNAAYKTTAVNDTWDEIEAAFGGPADFTCRFREFEISYYIDPAQDSLHPDAGSELAFAPKKLEFKSQIPYSEGAKQYLVKDGVVIAHVRIGAALHVQTIDGPIKARSMRDLSDEFFERHGNR